MEHNATVTGINRYGLAYISPLKRKIAQAVSEVGGQFRELNRIIIFGSAVTPKCHEGSDLDICLDVSSEDGKRIFQMQKQIGDLCNWNCDILMYGSLGERLKKTIQNEGVVIYEQPSE